MSATGPIPAGLQSLEIFAGIADKFPPAFLAAEIVEPPPKANDPLGSFRIDLLPADGV